MYLLTCICSYVDQANEELEETNKLLVGRRHIYLTIGVIVFVAICVAVIASLAIFKWY